MPRKPVRNDLLPGPHEATAPRGIERRKKRPLPQREWFSDDEVCLLRDLCRRDFWTFFLYGFGAGNNPKGKRWIDNAVHEPIADWFQHHVLDWHSKRINGVGEQKHLAVLIHREVGKSTMIAQAGQAWLHALDPEISTYTGSERLELSMKGLAAIKAVMDGSDPYAMFPKLYGNWSGSARTWTGREVVHAARRNTSRKDPSLGTFAVETSITGAHPDAIFYDDPISYERLSSDSNWLGTVKSQISSLIPVIQSDGLVVWVGTRYDDDDHFGTAFHDEGIASVTGMESDSLPVSEGGKWHVYFMAGRDREGKPTTPKVWPERRLKDYQRHDPLRYASQVMNDPAISEFNPLTKEQAKDCLVPKERVPWSALRYAICCDTAFWDGTKLAGKDETVMIVHGYPKDGSGDVYVVEGYGSNTMRAENLGKLLVSTVQRYRRQGRRIFAITDEVTMSGKKDAWKLALRNFFSDVNEPMPTFYEFNRGGKDKIKRIAAASAFWVDGHVKVVEGSPGSERLIEQMTRIGQMMANPKSKNDWADAHSDGFQPELYQPMRRVMNQHAPYERGAQAFHVEGLRSDDFDDRDTMSWDYDNPRPPIR